MATTADGHHIADERFPSGTKVTISGFEPGDWHVSWQWPEDVPAGLEHQPRIAGRGADGVHGYAYIDPDRLTAIP
jgi:hypothetical protein